MLTGIQVFLAHLYDMAAGAKHHRQLLANSLIPSTVIFVITTLLLSYIKNEALIMFSRDTSIQCSKLKLINDSKIRV